MLQSLSKPNPSYRRNQETSGSRLPDCWRKKSCAAFIRFDKWRKRLFYKRRCQGTFFSCTGGADIFRDIQPLSPLKTLVWCRALWGWVCVVPYQQVDLLGCDNAERFLKLGKRCGCTVSTMILVSATHPTAETLTCSAST